MRMFRLAVRKVAEAHGFMTPGHLARESRVSYSTVYKLWHEPEKAQNGLTLGVLGRIAQTLGVKLTELLEETGVGNWVPELLAA